MVERGRGRSERDAVRRDGDPRDLLAAARRSWRLPDVYAAIVALVGAVFVPWCLFATTRILGGSRLAALLAGLLALAPSDVYFWWLVGHGTLPALVSAALAPLIVALAWRVFLRHDHRWPVVLLLAAALLLGVFWALIVLMVGPPLLLGAALYWRRLRRRDLVLAGALGRQACCWSTRTGSSVFSERTWGTPPPPGPQSLAWRRFVEDSLQPILLDPNPAVLLLGAAGTLLLPRPLRVWSTEASSCGSWRARLSSGPAFLRLELDRFFVPLAIALIPPAGLGCRQAPAHPRPAPHRRSSHRSWRWAWWQSSLLHLDGVWRQYSGQIRRTARQIDFLSDPTRELVDWIRTSADPGARVLDLGRPPGARPARGRLQGLPPAAHGTAAHRHPPEHQGGGSRRRRRSFARPTSARRSRP